jgi:hypothetical protein
MKTTSFSSSTIFDHDQKESAQQQQHVETATTSLGIAS